MPQVSWCCLESDVPPRQKGLPFLRHLADRGGVIAGSENSCAWPIVNILPDSPEVGTPSWYPLHPPRPTPPYQKPPPAPIDRPSRRPPPGIRAPLVIPDHHGHLTTKPTEHPHPDRIDGIGGTGTLGHESHRLPPASVSRHPVHTARPGPDNPGHRPGSVEGGGAVVMQMVVHHPDLAPPTVETPPTRGNDDRAHHANRVDLSPWQGQARRAPPAVTRVIMPMATLTTPTRQTPPAEDRCRWVTVWRRIVAWGAVGHVEKRWSHPKQVCPPNGWTDWRSDDGQTSWPSGITGHLQRPPKLGDFTIIHTQSMQSHTPSHTPNKNSHLMGDCKFLF